MARRRGAASLPELAHAWRDVRERFGVGRHRLGETLASEREARVMRHDSADQPACGQIWHRRLAVHAQAGAIDVRRRTARRAGMRPYHRIAPWLHRTLE